jgi:hypothetical protein
MSTKAPSLSRQVKARQKFLNEAVNSVLELLRDHGKIIKREVGSSNTHTIRELSIGPFKFVADTGMTMVGGNTLEITHTSKKAGTHRVLEVYWQVFEFKAENSDAVVEIFKDDREWQSTLRRLMRDKEKELSKIRDAATKESHKRRADQEKLAKATKLQSTAERLGITTG